MTTKLFSRNELWREAQQWRRAKEPFDSVDFSRCALAQTYPLGTFFTARPRAHHKDVVSPEVQIIRARLYRGR